MLALIISLLIQFGIITSAQQYHNASPTQQQQYHEVIDDDITGI